MSVSDVDLSRAYDIARKHSPTGTVHRLMGELIDRRQMDVVVTPSTLLAMLRKGYKMRPTRWHQSDMLRDGYCYVRDQHTFIEYTPKTIGHEVSPAIAGAEQAVERYGNEWELLTP